MAEETRFGIVDNFSFLSYYCLHTLLKRPAQKSQVQVVFQLLMSFHHHLCLLLLLLLLQREELVNKGKSLKLHKMSSRPDINKIPKHG